MSHLEVTEIFNTLALVFLLFFSWPHDSACGILFPQPGMKPTSLATEAQSLNHWTAREVPSFLTSKRKEFTLRSSEILPAFKNLILCKIKRKIRKIICLRYVRRWMFLTCKGTLKFSRKKMNIPKGKNR